MRNQGNSTFVTECPGLGKGAETLIREWLQAHPGARLIVIDTLARIRPPVSAKDNQYASDHAIGEYLGALCRDFQVAILVVHHTRKAIGEEPIDEISGTLGLTGGVDGYMVMKRPAHANAGTLYVAGRRIKHPGEHVIEWDPDSARWTLTGENPQLVGRTSELPRRMVEKLREIGLVTVKALTKALHPEPPEIDARDPRYQAVWKTLHRLDKLFERVGARLWQVRAGGEFDAPAPGDG